MGTKDLEESKDESKGSKVKKEMGKKRKGDEAVEAADANTMEDIGSSLLNLTEAWEYSNP